MLSSSGFEETEAGCAIDIVLHHNIALDKIDKSVAVVEYFGKRAA